MAVAASAVSTEPGTCSTRRPWNSVVVTPSMSSLRQGVSTGWACGNIGW